VKQMKTDEFGGCKELIYQIRKTTEKIKELEGLFALETDDDLIESRIYEINAQHARYRFLLKCAREGGVRCPEGFGQLVSEKGVVKRLG